MSLWRSVSKIYNGNYEMKFFYDQKGMYDIRVEHADWIEEKLKQIGATSLTIEEQATQFHNDLKDHLHNPLYSQKELSLIFEPMKHISSEQLYTHFIDGTTKEIFLVEEINRDNQMHQMQLESLQMSIKSCKEFYQNLTNPEANQEINDHLSYLTKIIVDFELWKDSVFNKLKNWQKKQIEICFMDNQDQARIIFDQEHEEKLNKIQSCFELLFEVTRSLLQVIDFLQTQEQAMSDETLEQYALRIKKEHENLINGSLIVNTQPRRIIKSHVSFRCSVRSLLGYHLGFKNAGAIVECLIVTEAEADKVNKGWRMTPLIETTPANMSGNEVQLECQELKSVQFVANFDHLIISKIQRAGLQSSSHTIMDEKFALLFRMKVNIDNSNYMISALSAPVVVIVHGHQEPVAWATIMWDNTFSEVGRNLFDVPYEASWTKLVDALYSKCFSETKRGFTDANRNFFYELCFPNNIELTSTSEKQIAWPRFCKDNVDGCSFTFLEWFYYAIKLIKKHLLKPWQHNLIEGFISRRTAEINLLGSKPGTFLLRFSQSFKGAIIVSYVNAQHGITHKHPWDIRDLENCSLADRLNQCFDISELFSFGIDKSDLTEEFGGIDRKPYVSLYFGENGPL